MIFGGGGGSVWVLASGIMVEDRGNGGCAILLNVHEGPVTLVINGSSRSIS